MACWESIRSPDTPVSLRSRSIEIQRASSEARHVGRAVDRVEFRGGPLEIGCGDGRGTSTKFRRLVLSRELVESAGHARRSAAEHVVRDVRPILTEADKTVGLAGVCPKSDRVKFVLGEDLACDERNGVWINARIPVWRQLLLLKEIIHSGLVWLPQFAKRREKFASHTVSGIPTQLNVKINVLEKG
nr:hypothetical protein CFP56_30805 [Quercus suber]